MDLQEQRALPKMVQPPEERKTVFIFNDPTRWQKLYDELTDERARKFLALEVLKIPYQPR